jgi:hypothetical protein
MATHESSKTPMPVPVPPLRQIDAPAGWTLRYHQLHDVEPESLGLADPRWGLFGQDLLQIVQDKTGLVLDVGWYPEEAPHGRFNMVLIRGHDWESPLLTFAGRSLEEVVSRVQHVMGHPPIVEPLPVSEPTLENLSAIMEGSPDSVEAAKAAARLGEQHGAAAIPVLLAHLGDPRPRVRYAVVDALRRCSDAVVGPALFTRYQLPEPDTDTRRLLIRALGEVGYAPAIPTLIRLLHDPDARQREAAAWALGELKAKAALPAMVKAYELERDRGAHESMQIALQKIGGANR